MYMYVCVYIYICVAFAQVYVYSMCVYVCATACFSAHETKCLQQNQPRAKMHVFLWAENQPRGYMLVYIYIQWGCNFDRKSD